MALATCEFCEDCVQIQNVSFTNVIVDSRFVYKFAARLCLRNDLNNCDSSIEYNCFIVL